MQQKVSDVEKISDARKDVMQGKSFWQFFWKFLVWGVKIFCLSLVCTGIKYLKAHRFSQ